MRDGASGVAAPAGVSRLEGWAWVATATWGSVGLHGGWTATQGPYGALWARSVSLATWYDW